MAKKTNRFSKEPSFDNWETLTGEEFHHHYRHAYDYYYGDETLRADDLCRFVTDWMKANGYSRQNITSVNRAKKYITRSIASRLKLLTIGCPEYNPKEDEYWQSLGGTTGSLVGRKDYTRARIQEIIDAGTKTPSEDTTSISIQDRIRERSSDIIAEIETLLDELAVIDFVSFFAKQEVNSQHARHIKDYYTPVLNEYLSIKTCDQLKDAYANTNKADIKRTIEFLENLLSACDFTIAKTNKTRKPRKKKTASKEKNVARLKYQESDADLQLVSIQPINIPGSSVLWVYNTKYRRLAYYEGQLSVKGTSIIGFDEEKSFFKTLRKPDEQLKEFLGLSKPQKLKYARSIKTKPSPVNGRMNDTTILLCAHK